jgi:hypothetical protein
MTVTVTDEQLGLLLQLARDFAFGQMSDGRRLVPFAARMPVEGDIDFIRFVDEGTVLPVSEVYQRTQATMRRQVRNGELLAVATVATVQVPEADLGKGFTQAVRVHVEAAGFSREVLTPYRVEQGATGQPGQLVTGQMMAVEAAPAAFDMDQPDDPGQEGPRVFHLT